MGELGSVYRRSSDGRWVAAIRVGKRKIVRYAASERAARALLKGLTHSESLGILVPPTTLTLNAWTDRWLDDSKQTLRVTTLANYRSVLKPVLALLGELRLDHLTPDRCALLLTQLERDGITPSRRQLAYDVLGRALKTAVKRRLLGSNPLDGVNRPRAASKQRRYWTLAEAKQFLACAGVQRSQYGELFCFMLLTGLRRGEVLGLRWQDIEGDLLHVREQIAFIAGNAVRGDTKTAAAVRDVFLPAQAQAILAKLSRGNADERVFQSRVNTIPKPSTLARALLSSCKEAGVPPSSLHALRHLHISILVESGANIAAVARQVGHRRLSLTLDRYTHPVTPEQEMRTLFDELLR